MTGENIGNQRFRFGNKQRIFIGAPGDFGEIRRQNIPAVLSAKSFIELISGENDSFVKVLYQAVHFLHMGFSVGAA